MLSVQDNVPSVEGNVPSVKDDVPSIEDFVLGGVAVTTLATGGGCRSSSMLFPLSVLVPRPLSDPGACVVARAAALAL